MAVQKRFSIAKLMAVVFLVAADFAIVREVWQWPVPSVGIAVVTLPTINVLLLAIQGLRRGRASRAYWVGFEAAGWAMVLLSAALGWTIPDPFFAPIDWIGRHDPFTPGTAPKVAFLITFAVVLYSAPPLLAAWLVGRFSSRYRLVIQRRPGANAGPPGDLPAPGEAR